MRTLCHLVRAVLCGALFSAAVFAAEASRKNYDIPVSDAAVALKQFSAISGRETLFAAETVRGVKTPAVKGALTAQEALDALLAGTGLIATIDVKTGAIAVRRETPAEPKNDPSRRADREAAGVNAMDANDPRSRVKNGVVEMEDYTVTGSRIRSLQGQATANPVFTWTAEDFERSGVASLGEFRAMIPQLGVTSGVGGTGLTGGTTSYASQSRVDFNLRGIGSDTTLVLVNGRRMARSGQATGTDAFNPDGIPLAMIDRIEVLTAGSSALYGADAVSGVVNIILKKHFVGSEVTLTYDNTFETDLAVKSVNVSTGYRSGRFSLTASASCRENNEQKLADRWFTRTENRGTWASSTLDQAPGGAGSLTARTGVLPGIGARSVAIPVGANGQNLTVASYQAAGPIAPRFDIAPFFSAINPSERRNALVQLAYDWKPTARFFLDANWSEAVTEFADRPIRVLNLLLPAGYAGNPFGVPVQLSKVFLDLPRSHRVSTTRNSSVVFGARGDLSANWNYEAAASFASSMLSDYYRDNIGSSFNSVLLNAAINNPDPTRRPILIYDSSTGTNPNPPGLLESLTRTDPRRDETRSSHYTAHVSGPVFTLPTGDVFVAIGTEYRADEVTFVSNTPLLSTAPERTVTSAFAELQVPLVSAAQNLPWLEQLEFNLAGRIDDHNDFGQATTPRVSFLARPVKWITFRASRGEGFKAPSLAALYAPLSEFEQNFGPFTTLFDPLRNEFVQGVVTTVSGGNPDLRAEQSVTWNWGVAVDVAFIPGLSFTVDHYDIDYRDRAEDLQFTPQLLVDSYPERVTRGPAVGGVPGPIIGLDLRSINTARSRTSGFDYQLSYHRRTPWGRFAFRGQMSDPQRYDYRAAASDPWAPLNFPRRISGTVSLGRGPVDLAMAGTYQSEYRISPSQTYTAPSRVEWTPTVSYDFDRATWVEAKTIRRVFKGMKLTVSVPNVFNHQPSPEDAARSFVIVQDPRLRRYVLTLRKQF